MREVGDLERENVDWERERLVFSPDGYIKVAEGTGIYRLAWCFQFMLANSFFSAGLTWRKK